DGDPIPLTQHEFAVLEHLARRAPDVVPKSGLLDAVWGIDFDGDPNIVEVYVGYLRRKLGRDAVRTVRHVGYQLTGHSGGDT
ncbi:MAG: winged helix-turn-helix domain-containing protein, partial [Acidimicrobiia bacterium]